MDTQSTVIGVAMLLFAVVPILIFRIQKKKRDQRIIDKLEALMQTKVNKVTSYEIWNDRGIAIDKIADKIYYVSQHEGISEEQVVDLTHVNSCKVLKESSTIVVDQETAVNVHKVSLELKLVKHEEVHFDFYDEKQDGATMRGEIQLAHKWQEFISRYLFKEVKS